MQALVFRKPRHLSFETVADPRVEDPTDAILRVTATAIGGSDLHIYNGFIPQARNLILGHEFVGIVQQVGANVRRVQSGDRVIAPFPIACGQCFFCKRGLTPHCERSNPTMYGPDGNETYQAAYSDPHGTRPGGQAELVRVPFADFTLRVLPPGMPDTRALFLNDTLPAGWTAVDWGRVSGGDTVAVFGCGPVGLMAMSSALTARMLLNS
jgi:S-(hydroxymethyl)glutathione dehydrogenase/alcohol dehydrogenase